MTIYCGFKVFIVETLNGTTSLSSRPERSVVEGPAVSFDFHHQRLR
jgi:hypothetical protein